MARKRLVDIISNDLERKSPLTGTEETLIRDGAASKKARISDIAAHVVAQGGVVGQALFAAQNSEEAAAAIPDVATATALVASIGQANGVCELDSAALVPAAHIPTDLAAYQSASALLEAIAGLAAAADKLIYLTGESAVGLADLTAYARTFLAASDEETARAALGAVIGVDVQGFFVDLTTTDTGVLRRAEDGTWLIDGASDFTTFAQKTYVDSAINTLRNDPDPFTQYLQFDDFYEAIDAELDDFRRSGVPVATENDPFPRWKPVGAKLLVENDFISNSYTPWVQANLGTGSVGATTADADRNGAIALKGGTVANDGARFMTGQSGILLRAGSMFQAVVALNSLANEAMLLGFHDTITTAAHTDAATFKMVAGGAISAITAKSGTTTTAGTSFTPTTGVYYAFRITVLTGFTGVRFQIFDASFTSVYDVTLTTNLPDTTANEVGNGIIITSSAVNSPITCYVDRFSLLLY